MQEISFAYVCPRHYAGRYFFIAEHRFSTEHDCLSHAGEAQQMRFHFRGVHLFTCDVDYVRDPTDDFESGTVTRQQIVGNKNSIAEFFFVWLWEIAITYSSAAHVNLARRSLWSYEVKGGGGHRFANEPFVRVCRFAVVPNSATFGRPVKRVDW